MNFCSNCGSNALDFKVPEGDSYSRFVCSNCGIIHYQNPRIIVGCLALYNEQILLCKRAIEPRYGFWNLPGGFMENGETVEEGAKRETLEETNAKVDIVRLHSVYNIPHVNQVYLHFLANMKEPYFTETSESLEVTLFNQSDIPWDDIAFSSTAFSIKKYLEHKGEEKPEVHLGEYRMSSKS